jgi:hypothetical protein
MQTLFSGLGINVRLPIRPKKQEKNLDIQKSNQVSQR